MFCFSGLLKINNVLFVGKSDAFSHLKLIFEKKNITLAFSFNLYVFLAFYSPKVVYDATELLD